MAKFDNSARYTEKHEWARLEGELVTIGITDYAQAQLNDIVYVELPEVGTQLHRGQTCAVVESVKAASDCYAPVSGEVVAVNRDLEQDPGLINRDPYGAGWLVRVRPSDPAEMKALLDVDAYRKLLPEEWQE